MNKTESAYCQHLEQRKRAGEIAWYRFEGIKLRLADNTFYTPDFAVMLATGEM
ncbi:gp8 domain protein [Escherichia coli STEC_S1191]|nr:gp8 domain protein [Escherichia coli STEC_S1191]